jgi:type II secretory pathway pseudopilin PulG
MTPMTSELTGGTAPTATTDARGTAISARGASLALHRDGRGAPPPRSAQGAQRGPRPRARRDDREYRLYSSQEQRSLWGCIARRKQPDLHHGLVRPGPVSCAALAMRSRHRVPRGYVLIELLVSAVVACTVLGVLLRLAVMAQNTVRTQGDLADLQQRLRVAVEAIRRDLLAAGAGPSNGALRGPLIDAFAPVLPGRSGVSGADAELSYHPDRITIVYVPRDGSQTRLAGSMAGPGAPLLLDANAPGCPSGNVCGFNAGDRVLIYAPAEGDGGYDIFTVSAADATQALLLPGTPLSRAYPADSRVVTIVQRVYYLDRPGRRLMVYDGNRSDVPLVDHVVDLRFRYYGDPAPASVSPPPDGLANCAYAAGTPPLPLLPDLGGIGLVLLTAGQLTDGPACGRAPARFDADLRRLRRIGVALRLETEGAEFRGSGPAFANPGTSLDADRYIPDIEIAFDVAPRNLLNTSLR